MTNTVSDFPNVAEVLFLQQKFKELFKHLHMILQNNLRLLKQRKFNGLYIGNIASVKRQ